MNWTNDSLDLIRISVLVRTGVLLVLLPVFVRADPAWPTPAAQPAPRPRDAVE